MKKYIISAFVLVVGLGLIGLKFYSDNKNAPIIEEVSTATSTESASTTAVKIDQNKIEIDKAWAVLQKYLAFAKNNDEKGIASLSYQIGPDCKNFGLDATSTNSCKAKMQNVYNLGKDFKRADFIGILGDTKQEIIFTDWLTLDASDTAGLIRSIVYFIKDKDGNLKLLSFNPSKGAFISKVGLTSEQIKQKLVDLNKDTDQDTAEDVVENCINQPGVCTKTDPTKRDSDSNGYWDGVQDLFYK